MRAVEPDAQALFTLNTGTPVSPRPGRNEGVETVDQDSGSRLCTAVRKIATAFRHLIVGWV